MANAKKCDRCGKYYDGGKRKLLIYDRTINIQSSLDLCEKCETELEQWFDNPDQVIGHHHIGDTDHEGVMND